MARVNHGQPLIEPLAHQVRRVLHQLAQSPVRLLLRHVVQQHAHNVVHSLRVLHLLLTHPHNSHFLVVVRKGYQNAF